MSERLGSDIWLSFCADLAGGRSANIHMTDETKTHLNEVEAAIHEAKRLLAKHEYADELRNVLVIGFIDQMIEHHESMLALIRSGKTGSAFALARSVFESMYRGLWINLCASDAQITEFEKKDELPLTMGQMAKAIDTTTSDPADPHQFFSDLKSRGWSGLCSYTHTGLLQLGSRFTGHNVEPAYKDAEIVEITSTTTTCVLLSVGRFLVTQNHADDAKAAEALIETYGKAAEQALQAQQPNQA